MQQQNKPTTQQQTAIAKQSRPVDILKSMLKADSVQEQFTNALGKHRDAYIASVIDLYTSDKQLQTCKPQDIIAQALKAASMQLPINKALGFAYIVVYNNSVKVQDEHGRDKWVKVPTPTFIPGYKGYIQLAMRTGQYRYINADFVYEGELRQINRLTGEVALDGERKSDKIVGYFGYIELLNGFSKTLYMSVDDMAKYAKRYAPSLGKATVEALIKLANTEQSGKQVGWLGNFNDMALKTVTRRLLSKYGYLSVEMQGAVADDIAVNEQRNDLLAENANSVEFNANEVEFEEIVDKETGEVMQRQAAAAQPTQSESAASESATDDDPGY